VQFAENARPRHVIADAAIEARAFVQADCDVLAFILASCRRAASGAGREARHWSRQWLAG
jgi:hypothetical protein